MRHAISLGLHVDIVNRPVDSFERGEEARLFYSVYNFEIFLAEVTGRPPAISTDNVTISTDVLFDSQEPLNHTANTNLGISPTDAGQWWAGFQKGQNKPQEKEFQPIFPRWNIRNVKQTISQKYFPYRTRLCKISHRINSELYSGVSESATQ